MQLELIENFGQVELPSTRYQGSKAKIADWIWHSIEGLRFDTVLDAFGGTGSVSYYLKRRGKAVTYNDFLMSNAISARAMIENQSVEVSAAEVDEVLEGDCAAGDFVERMFDDIFFLPEENRWIDRVSSNIRSLPDGFKRAIFYRALFQSCIVKRPYNLFHRKNLYMRTADVERNFGNKATWDTPFEKHFRSFVTETNRLVFDSGTPCRALCLDVGEVPGQYDLVYMDPPYVNAAGVGIDYRDFYHFLEGLADYDKWAERIDIRRKHRPLFAVPSQWTRGKSILRAFDTLCRKHSDSILAISYRSDGIPSEQELVDLLRKYKRHVEVLHYGSYKYALSKNDGSREILILGHDG
jgi:adenine-specific DNA methylase